MRKGWDSRHPNCHGRSSHTIDDVLDELITGLHLHAQLVQRHLLRDYGLQELEELSCALYRVGDLSIQRSWLAGRCNNPDR